ncbi:hypothetical protein RHGRI_031477 [Rhododendron griersonianum]|uniref:Uncharacterized protein n=1 Tax=Rhododendron griersonianum TaxID=479676 RepID=A0AAV6I8C5_9ERIC|nr:hypothetical protein RHGRI_031477 [Rhododendron griersonianum]
MGRGGRDVGLVLLVEPGLRIWIESGSSDGGPDAVGVAGGGGADVHREGGREEDSERREEKRRVGNGDETLVGDEDECD